MAIEERGVAARRQAVGLADLLDHDGLPAWAADTLPPLGHWLCFPPHARQSALGADGHPHRADGEDGSDLPRRMWAGSRIRFLRPVAYEAPLLRSTTVASTSMKQGRSGRMLLMTLRHEIEAGGKTAIVEEQDIVFREAAGAMPALPGAKAMPAIDGSRRIVADETMLFRYSALTFNAHRIHYDEPYATGVEGYPGLVVHGPLAATMLLDHHQRAHPDRAVVAFSFRAASPLFANELITLVGDAAGLRAIDARGTVAMTATVEHA